VGSRAPRSPAPSRLASRHGSQGTRQMLR
jgi:hypothetical protein